MTSIEQLTEAISEMKVNYTFSFNTLTSKMHSNISYKMIRCEAYLQGFDMIGYANRSETSDPENDQELLKKLAREDLCHKIGLYFGELLEEKIFARELNELLAVLQE